MSPIISPLSTAVALVGDALADRDRADAPPQLRRALLAQLRKRDIAALLPLRAGTRLDAVLAIDPDGLRTSIDAALAAGHPAGPWRPVARDPRRWLRSYAEALRRAWVVLEPVWRRSAALRERDVERVSVALAHGAGPELIAQVFPYWSVAGDDLLLPSHSDRPGCVRVGSSLFRIRCWRRPPLPDGPTTTRTCASPCAARFQALGVRSRASSRHPLRSRPWSGRGEHGSCSGSSGRRRRAVWPSCCRERPA